MQLLNQRIAPLLRVPLFMGLDGEQLKELAHGAQRVTFKAGETLVREGEANEAAYLILHGKAEQVSGPGFDGAPQRLAPGTMIGELAMLIGMTHGSTVVARSKVRALKFERGMVHELLRHDPGMAEHFMDVLLSRLAGIAAQIRAIDEQLAGEQTAKAA